MPTTREMPRYKCHKEVHAFKIKDIEKSGCSASFIVPAEEGFKPIEMSAEWINQHEPQIGGYIVFYSDGYTSYSPAKAFEQGYTRIN